MTRSATKILLVSCHQVRRVQRLNCTCQNMEWSWPYTQDIWGSKPGGDPKALLLPLHQENRTNKFVPVSEVLTSEWRCQDVSDVTDWDRNLPFEIRIANWFQKPALWHHSSQFKGWSLYVHKDRSFKITLTCQKYSQSLLRSLEFHAGEDKVKVYLPANTRLGT